ncbi:MAG: hypothetical protein GX620_04070 [Chloroflexi bacterium]|nr:hypothetical protein [Chloroflexota bacterium]
MNARVWLTSLLHVGAALLVGCALRADLPTTPQLRFEADVALNNDRECQIDLGIRNVGPECFAGDARFEGQMEIRDAADTLRASANALEMAAIAADNVHWAMRWRGQLAPGVYRMTWGSDKYGFIVVKFAIVERNGRLHLTDDVLPVDTDIDGQSFTAGVAVEDRDTSVSEIDAAVAGNSPVATDDWTAFEVEPYGFELAIPPDWKHKDLTAPGTNMPSDWPVKRTVIFYPQDWADRFERNGPPDANAPPAIPAVSLEICIGSEEQFRRAYVEPNHRETLTINGVDVVREESGSSDYITVQYVLESPLRSDARIVLIDHFSGFTVRSAEYADIVELISAIIGTAEFTEQGARSEAPVQ